MKYTKHLKNTIKSIIIFLALPIISVFNVLCVVSLIFYDIYVSIKNNYFYKINTNQL